MAGPEKQSCYDLPFSTLLTRKLIVAILAGEVSSPDQLRFWMDAHHADYALD
jgi:hypothetical protein